MNRTAAACRAPHPSLLPSLLFALVCCSLLPTVTGCSGKDGGKAPAERLIPAVEATRARHGALPLTLRVSGLVQARNQVEIHPELSAVVTDVLVADGDTVVRGQPLVRLRDTEFAQRLSQAQANRRIAEAQLRRAEAQAREAAGEFARLQSLAVESLASAADLEAGAARAETAQAEVELAQARVDQARSQADEADENLQRTVVRSPIDGSVGNRKVEPGQLAGPATSLLTLGQLDSVRVRIILTDRMLADIAEGQRTEILLEQGALSAPLSRISPFLNPVSHTTTAEIDLPNPDHGLKPGMFVPVDVHYGESEEATLVPLSAVYEHPLLAQTGVYVATEDIPVDLSAETGGRDAAFLTAPVGFRFVPVEVVAEGRMEAAVRPLEPGAWVVTLGQNLLSGEDAQARVRPVQWQRVQMLQNLQRDDLMRALNGRTDGAGGR